MHLTARMYSSFSSSHILCLSLSVLIATATVSEFEHTMTFALLASCRLDVQSHRETLLATAKPPPEIQTEEESRLAYCAYSNDSSEKRTLKKLEPRSFSQAMLNILFTAAEHGAVSLDAFDISSIKLHVARDQPLLVLTIVIRSQ